MERVRYPLSPPVQSLFLSKPVLYDTIASVPDAINEDHRHHIPGVVTYNNGSSSLNHSPSSSPSMLLSSWSGIHAARSARRDGWRYGPSPPPPPPPQPQPFSSMQPHHGRTGTIQLVGATTAATSTRPPRVEWEGLYDAQQGPSTFSAFPPNNGGRDVDDDDGCYSYPHQQHSGSDDRYPPYLPSQAAVPPLLTPPATDIDAASSSSTVFPPPPPFPSSNSSMMYAADYYSHRQHAASSGMVRTPAAATAEVRLLMERLERVEHLQQLQMQATLQRHPQQQSEARKNRSTEGIIASTSAIHTSGAAIAHSPLYADRNMRSFSATAPPPPPTVSMATVLRKSSTAAATPSNKLLGTDVQDGDEYQLVDVTCDATTGDDTNSSNDVLLTAVAMKGSPLLLPDIASYCYEGHSHPSQRQAASPQPFVYHQPALAVVETYHDQQHHPSHDQATQTITNSSTQTTAPITEEAEEPQGRGKKKEEGTKNGQSHQSLSSLQFSSKTEKEEDSDQGGGRWLLSAHLSLTLQRMEFEERAMLEWQAVEELGELRDSAGLSMLLRHRNSPRRRGYNGQPVQLFREPRKDIAAGLGPSALLQLHRLPSTPFPISSSSSPVLLCANVTKANKKYNSCIHPSSSRVMVDSPSPRLHSDQQEREELQPAEDTSSSLTSSKQKETSAIVQEVKDGSISLPSEPNTRALPSEAPTAPIAAKNVTIMENEENGVKQQQLQQTELCPTEDPAADRQEKESRLLSPSSSSGNHAATTVNPTTSNDGKSGDATTAAATGTTPATAVPTGTAAATSTGPRKEPSHRPEGVIAPARRSHPQPQQDLQPPDSLTPPGTNNSSNGGDLSTTTTSTIITKREEAVLLIQRSERARMARIAAEEKRKLRQQAQQQQKQSQQPQEHAGQEQDRHRRHWPEGVVVPAPPGNTAPAVANKTKEETVNSSKEPHGEQAEDVILLLQRSERARMARIAAEEKRKLRQQAQQQQNQPDPPHRPEGVVVPPRVPTHT